VAAREAPPMRVAAFMVKTKRRNDREKERQKLDERIDLGQGE
jgi:hypothetical protein